MTRPYFRQVPNFEYASRDSGKKYISEYVEVKNLFKRGKLRDDIFGNLAFFEKYSIIGDERPDNVAFKFYGDSTLDWVVLLSNNILNIQSEWPMTQRSFDRVMLKKYGTTEEGIKYYQSLGINVDSDSISKSEEFAYEVLYNGIHHHETSEIKNSLGATVLKSGIIINPSWKTNGNFLEINNSKIEKIYSGDGEEPSDIATVELKTGILGLEEGKQIIVSNVLNNDYNGQFFITDIVSASSGIVTEFKYQLQNIPIEATPPRSTPTKEEVLYAIPEGSGISGNSYYYEYYDEGLGYSVQIPSNVFVNPVTNYEYEKRIEDAKRNIYILKQRYLNVVFNDIDDIMPYKEGSRQYVTENLKRADNIRLYE